MPRSVGDSDAPSRSGPNPAHGNLVSVPGNAPNGIQAKQTPVCTQTNVKVQPRGAESVPAARQAPQNPAVGNATSETRTGAGNDRVTVDKPRQPLISTTIVSKPTIPRTGPPKVVLQAPMLGTQAIGVGAASPKKVNVAIAKSTATTMPTAAAQIDLSKSNVTSMITTQNSGAPTTATAVSSIPLQTPVAMIPTRPMVPSTATTGSIPPPVNTVLDQQASAEQALEAKRRPLTNLYGPVLVPQDTCLADARKRLETAITQTRQLRQSFTRRVYEKYRVCLKPPPTAESVMKSIRDDPQAFGKRIGSEIEQIKRDKEDEKKEVQAVTGEIGASDNMDHLMYITAGLNAVVLPETEMPEEWKTIYPERGPISLETGTRSKGISQAAATAGELTLERTRKAVQLHVDRQRRKQLRHLAGDEKSSLGQLNTPISLTNGPSGALIDASLYGPVTSRKSIAKAAIAGAAKPSTTSNRGRGSSAIPASVLLGLHPEAEQFSNHSETNETAAMTALKTRGFSTSSAKTPQQRLRHPHPDSMGGRRRASSHHKKDPKEHFPEAFLSMTLPPLPATKERVERRPQRLREPDDAAPDRAKKAVRNIVRQFVDDDGGMKDTTKIRLLHSLRQISNENSAISADEEPESLGPGAPPSDKTPLDPVIAFCVLHSVGLVGRSNLIEKRKKFELPPITEGLGVSSKLKRLHEKLSSTTRTLSSDVMSQSLSSEETGFEPPPKKQRGNPDSASAQEIKADSATEKPIPVLNIRGGCGEEMEDSSIRTSGSKKSLPVQQGQEEKSQENETVEQNGRTGERLASQLASSTVRPRGRSTSDSDAQRNDAAAIAYLRSQIARTTGTQLQGYMPNAGSLNALHIPTQLRMSNTGLSSLHHPAGDLASANIGYLGSLGRQHQNAYDLASFMPGTTTPQPMTSLAALGLGRQGSGLLGFSLEEREASARASLLYREQQTAALLQQSRAARAFPQTQSTPFRHVQAQNAMSALLGQTSQYPGGQLQSALAQGLYTPTPTTPVAVDARPRAETSSDKIPPAEATKTSLSPSRQNKEANKGGPKTVTRPPVKSVPLASDPSTKPKQEKSAADVRVKEAKSENGTRIQFLDPQQPSAVGGKLAKLIKSGRFYEVVGQLNDIGQQVKALDYLTSVGVAVPIPKALVLTPLKERLSASGVKNNSNGPPPIPRETVASAILVWLWANHESNFQKAFDKSGRMDVDPECKWLIQAAIDTSFRELTKDIADSMARNKGPFAEAAAARKAQMAQKQSGGDVEKSLASTKLQVHAATVVSRALMTELRIDPSMNFILGNFQDMVDYLDEVRLCALRLKAQEKTLLAALVSRKATMTESFSHAYTSAMVRAGEALGHDNLFECVQNERVSVSTMLPYDTFMDADQTWEDPCRPDEGFAAGVGAEQLMRRAHARAMIQKSLKKLQDKNHIRGGTPTHGPYTDPSTAPIFKPAPAPSPRPAKRRMSVISEPPIPPGTGSAAATSLKQYDPGHSSAPLAWDSTDIENTPYGRFSKSERARSVSLSLSARTNETKSKKTKRASFAPKPPSGTEHLESEGSLPRGTFEIAWGDVARIFNKVELPKKAIRAAAADSHAVDYDAHIFAPFCGETSVVGFDDDDESDTEEVELSEEVMLAKHQEILDTMKQKLNAFLEAKRLQQEKRKKR